MKKLLLKWIFQLKLHSLFCVLVALIFVSCEADINLKNISTEISLHPNLIVPIGAASVTMADLISLYDNQGKIGYGINNEIDYLNFDTTGFKFRDLNILKNAVETTKILYLPLPNPSTFSANTSLPTLTADGFFNLGLANNSDRIDSIVVNSATLSLQLDISPELQKLNPSDITITLLFPNGKVKNLDASFFSKLIKPGTFGTYKDVVLTNFIMNTSGNANAIAFQIKIEAKTGLNSFLLDSNSNFSCKVLLKDLNYKVAYGKFSSSITLSNILQEQINLAKNLPGGLYLFDNPQIDISASSNIGEFLNFKINYIKASETSKPTEIPVFANFNGSPSANFSFNRKPKLPGDTIQVKLKTFDKNWGATNHFFLNAKRPDLIEYSFSGSIDSLLSKTSTSPGFITPDAKIDIFIKTTLPIYLNAGSYFEHKDSIMNIFEPIASTLDKYSIVNEAALVLNISNGLPVKCSLSLLALDKNNLEIPTNFEKNYVIQSGQVDSQGIVQPGKESNQNLSLLFSKDKLSTLRKAVKIRYTIRIEGYSIISNIHFTKFNSFNIKAGLFVKGELNAKTILPK